MHRVPIIFLALLVPALGVQAAERENFQVAGRKAFVIEPPAASRIKGPMPWVWYAPTLGGGLPGKAEHWMFTRLHAKGIAIAGVDVSESYGSPKGRAVFQKLYEELTTNRNYGKKPVLLARSRGGLMLYNWAVEHPDSVGGVAGIYPVCNLTSYPGLKRAAGAYEMTADQLKAKLAEHNPVDRLAPLAKAKVPIFHIHGDSDKVVPLDANSALIGKRYAALGGPVEIQVIKGQGHNMWKGWFESRKLTDFMIAQALGKEKQQKAANANIPDLTKAIDFERNGEFFLGPTGTKGWIYAASNFMTTDARQILITQVAKGSAADGVLEVGDVILGVDGKHFSSDARKVFGHAINEAEKEQSKGVLKLVRWRPVKDATPRKGAALNVELKLKVMGSYSDTAPWNCPKTERILAGALKSIVESKNMGRLSATALALLATGEKEHLQIVRDYIHNAKWAKPDIQISVEIGGKQSWNCGFQNLLLTEYFLASGDKYVLPAIREMAIKTAMGQSNGGTWGHGFAWTKQNDGKLHGALPGYGALNQAGLPCFISLLLAKKCGIEHPEIDDAIERSNQFFKQFIGNGSIGYGYHRPSLEMNANGRNGMSGNGKNGLGAIAFGIQDHREGTRFFSRLTASLYNTCEYGHSGNSYSYFWDPVGANFGGPELVAAFLKELRWYHALTRKADGSFVNQPLGGTYGRGLLSPTAAQVLIATLPRRAIYLTGKGQKKDAWVNKDEARDAVAAGRWRSADVDAMRTDDLIDELGSWSPIAREWSARTLAKKKGDFVPRLIELLKHKKPEARAGACAALGYLGERAAVAVPHVSKALKDEKNIVSISAGYALARIGKSAQAAVPDLLRAVLDSKEAQPMRPRQQALAYSLGYASGRYAPLYFDGVLAQAPKGINPLQGVDRKLLYPALAKLFKDSSGRTRGAGAYAFKFFDRTDTAAMAQEIYEVIKTPAMNYKMMDDGPRARGLELMARLHLREGVSLCFETFDLHRWGAVMRVPARFKVLQMYAGNAKGYLPQLREMRKRWKSGEHRERLEKTIKIIETDKNPPPMISLHDLVDERLAKDLAVANDDKQRVELCRELSKKSSDDYFYRSAGLRKIVSIRGGEAFEDLLVAMDVPDEILRETAVTLGAKLSGDRITDRWIGQLATAGDHRLVGILEVLAHHKDPKSLPAVKKYLDHKNEAVRNAAIRAAAAMEKQSSR